METADVDICMYNTLKTFEWHKDLNDPILKSITNTEQVIW